MRDELKDTAKCRWEEENRQRHRAAYAAVAEMLGEVRLTEWKSLADCAHTIRNNALHKICKMAEGASMMSSQPFQAAPTNPYAIGKIATAIMFGAGALDGLPEAKNKNLAFTDNHKNNCDMAYAIGRIIDVFVIVGQSLTCERLSSKTMDPLDIQDLQKEILTRATKENLLDRDNLLARKQMRGIPLENIGISMRKYGGSIHDDIAGPLLSVYQAFCNVRHLKLVS